MMELKVRVWDGNHNRYEYPELIELNKGIDYELYTGQNDKNGKEIYSGDKDIRGTVKYIDGCYHIVQDNGQTFDYLFMIKNIEIIGNIHEGIQ